jgi:hypothetical protein
VHVKLLAARFVRAISRSRFLSRQINCKCQNWQEANTEVSCFMQEATATAVVPRKNIETLNIHNLYALFRPYYCEVKQKLQQNVLIF